MIGPVAALGHNRRNARISKQALAGMAVQQSSSAQPALSVDVERAERSDDGEREGPPPINPCVMVARHH